MIYGVESQLASLERLVPHLSQHGCDASAQDAAQMLMRYFDDDAQARTDKALASAYGEVRGRLKAVAEGRAVRLSTSNVALFIRCYREHLLRAAVARCDLDS